MEKLINNYKLSRKYSNKLKRSKGHDEVRMGVEKNYLALSIHPSPRRANTNEKILNLDSNNLLVLNLNHTSAYGHIYSEVFSELFAVDSTYSEYDTVVTIVTPLMNEIFKFFEIKLSKKINLINSIEQLHQQYLLNFNHLELVNHVPRSYNKKQENVLTLKNEFHRLRPIVNTSKQYVIFCSRSTTKAKHGRNITKQNEDEIVNYLKSYANENSLEFYFLTGEEPDGSTTPIAKQYELFSNAKIVVGPHGGVFSNLIFLDPAKKPKVIEFCPSWAKSFSRLFDGAIDTFAEYHQIPYILPQGLLSDLAEYDTVKTRNRYVADQLKDAECTIELVKLVESLHGVHLRMVRTKPFSNLKQNINDRVRQIVEKSENTNLPSDVL